MVDFDSVRKGMVVLDARGKKLGKVITRGNGRFLVERTGIVQEQHIVDDAQVQEIRDDLVCLSVDERFLEEQSMREPEAKPAVGSAATADEPPSEFRRTDVGDLEDRSVADQGGETAAVLHPPDVRREKP